MKKGIEIGNKKVLCSGYQEGKMSFSSSAPKRPEMQQGKKDAAFEIDSVALPAVEGKEILRKILSCCQLLTQDSCSDRVGDKKLLQRFTIREINSTLEVQERTNTAWLFSGILSVAS